VGIVALSRIFNKYVPGLRVTVVESGCSHENFIRLESGDLDFSGCSGSESAMDAYYGLRAWDGNPQSYARQLLTYSVGGQMIMVREDSGITSIKELEGIKFFMGQPGTGTPLTLGPFFEAIGVSPEPVYGSMADGRDMVKENKIVGMAKYSPVTVLDPVYADIRTVTPIRILSMTEEEAEAALKAKPGLKKMTIPAGSIAGAPEQGDILTGAISVTIALVPTESRHPAFTDDLVYSLVKAVDENWSEMWVSYPAAEMVNPVEDLINFFADLEAQSGLAPIPMHSGVVKYLKAKGVDVPASLIPPEYKG
jgi:hypothetical protein